MPELSLNFFAWLNSIYHTTIQDEWDACNIPGWLYKGGINGKESQGIELRYIAGIFILPYVYCTDTTAMHAAISYLADHWCMFLCIALFILSYYFLALHAQRSWSWIIQYLTRRTITFWPVKNILKELWKSWWSGHICRRNTHMTRLTWLISGGGQHTWPKHLGL